jgi:hypothetical protein
MSLFVLKSWLTGTLMLILPLSKDKSGVNYQPAHLILLPKTLGRLWVRFTTLLMPNYEDFHYFKSQNVLIVDSFIIS